LCVFVGTLDGTNSCKLLLIQSQLTLLSTQKKLLLLHLLSPLCRYWQLHTWNKPYLWGTKFCSFSVITVLYIPVLHNNLHWINTVTCCNLMANMFRSPFATIIRPILLIVCLPCAYNMGSNNVYKQFSELKSLFKTIHCYCLKTLLLYCYYYYYYYYYYCYYYYFYNYCGNLMWVYDKSRAV
jgi:hypothetical protein